MNRSIPAPIIFIALSLIIFITACVGLVRPAAGHEAMSGWAYPTYCCQSTDGKTGDCQRISSRTVTPIAGGYRVTLHVGDHQLVTRTHVFDVPQSQVRESGDGAFHACLFPTENEMRCFLAPPNGS